MHSPLIKYAVKIIDILQVVKLYNRLKFLRAQNRKTGGHEPLQTDSD